MAEIVYEKHPVSPERKAELIAQGKKIIDIRYAPKDYTPEPEQSGVPSKSDIATMKKSECVEWLEAHGVDAPDGTVLELRDMLRNVMFVE